jgi:alpha-N-arabinofuranosidase
VHYGWTPVMLSTLKSLGVTPDFIINHRYPEYSAAYSTASSDCDALLLQSTPAWAGDAADLRGQLTNYLGTAGTNVEMLVTENNSDAGAQGRQSTSLVNALYYADSAAQVMQTEFNGYIWWDLRNGSDTSGGFDPTLYGWRNNGDIAMVGAVTNCYPPYYAARLMQHFVQGGDSILAAASDFGLLTAYASRHADGSVGLLVINKDLAASLNTQVSVSSFTPWTNATFYSYGIPQDDAAQTGVGSIDILQTNMAIAGANFSYNFPPYSLTLFTLAPSTPQLLPGSVVGGRYVFQLQGQNKVPYEILTSTNLTTWTSNSVITLSGTNGMVTNTIANGARFWRAVWLP